MDDYSLHELAKRALSPDWQAAQVYRWATRKLTRKTAAELAEISLYDHDKITRTRVSPDGDYNKTIVYSRKEWRDMWSSPHKI